MDKIDSLNQTADFHRLFNHPILDKPTIPDKKRCDLRVELISEELKELKEAIETNDIVEIADALCDIQYVLSGAVHEFGMSEKFVELFNGRCAMICFGALIGAYATTGQIIPGVF